MRILIRIKIGRPRRRAARLGLALTWSLFYIIAVGIMMALVFFISGGLNAG
jgi:hypothetical protein